MTTELQKKLKDRWKSFTASEQKIATYLLHNIRELPFETAASLGKRVGVSPMTVGRFLRNLGYDGVGELKEELRGGAAWRHLYREVEVPQDTDAIASHLQTEMRALTGVHALAGGKEWAPIVKLLASADRVSVASFQQGAFLGLGLATMLQQIRPHVAFHSGADGAYVDMLLDSTRRSCVVLIDMRRYFRLFRTLAEEVVARGIPLVMITDTDCYWARELTPHVLMVHAERAWHGFSAYTSLFSLLVTAIAQEKGNFMDRLGDINQLRQKLVGYLGAAPGRGEPAAPDRAGARMAGAAGRRGKPRR